MHRLWRPLAAVVMLVGLVAFSFSHVGGIAHASPPTLTSFVPDYGFSGQTITVNGTGFSSTASNDTIELGGTIPVTASTANGTGTQLTFVLPAYGTIGAGNPFGSAVCIGQNCSNYVTFYVVKDGTRNCQYYIGNGSYTECPSNFIWTAGQTVQGNCTTGADTLANEQCATKSHTDCLYVPTDAPTHTCPHLDGEVIEVRWSDIESTQGTYNYTALDSQINAWVGKMTSNNVPWSVGINVEYLPDGGGTGSGTSPSATCNSDTYEVPSYVHSDANIAWYCDSTQTPGKGYYDYPNYCAADFTSDLDAFMSHLAEHIAQQAYQFEVAYVSPGLGIGHEDTEFRGNVGYKSTDSSEEWAFEQEEGAAAACVNSSNGSNTNFSNWARSRMEAWAQDFEYTKVYESYNSQFYGTSPTALQQLDEEHYALASNFSGEPFNHGLMDQNLSPNLTYAGLDVLDATLNQLTNDYPSSTMAGQYARGWETDTSVSSTNMASYVQTAYCYGGGYTNSGNNQDVTVAWYANIPYQSWASTPMADLHSYNDGVAPPSGDDTYCSGQNGYYNNP